MRRFLRVPTTLLRCFPLRDHHTLPPHEAVQQMMSCNDASGVTWRRKFQLFVDYLLTACSSSEREAHLDAALRTQTGEIRVEADDEEIDGAFKPAGKSKAAVTTLANIQVATGKTN